MFGRAGGPPLEPEQDEQPDGRHECCFREAVATAPDGEYEQRRGDEHPGEALHSAAHTPAKLALSPVHDTAGARLRKRGAAPPYPRWRVAARRSARRHL